MRRSRGFSAVAVLLTGTRDRSANTAIYDLFYTMVLIETGFGFDDVSGSSSG